MKTVIALSSLLLASSALAAPSQLSQMRREKRMQRRANGRSSNFPLAVNYTSMHDYIKIDHSKDVEYDSNWAGAVIVDSGITSVTGTFTVPGVSEPAGGDSNTQYGASAWVGIDGDTCQSAILQTGVDLIVQGGQASYSAWYEWFPDYSYTFDGFSVSPGDQIVATVEATSTTSGTATIENLSTGQSTSHTFTDESQVGTLCQTNAEWIVEDFESGSSLVPFANFGTVAFTGATYVADGNTKDTTGSSILDVEQNGQVETSCSQSGSSVTCTYQG